MTVGFHAPLPPARTGVADYASVLLAALRRFGRVETGSREADVNLYHLGNNQLHRRIYEMAIRRPGVAVLHDAVLQHFFLGALDRSSYLDEFVYNYGEWDRGLAEDLWASRARSAVDERYFRYPMLRRIAEVSRAVIVHNPAARRMVLRHAPVARVHEIPHLFQPPAPVAAAAMERLRRDLGSSGACLFVVFGYIRESKRLPAILKVLDRVRRDGVDAVLLVAGDFVAPDLEKQVAPLMRNAGVRRAGMASEREFWLRASAADACINLRHPAAGETSGITIRLMGIGKPVIVTDGEEVSGFPEGACLRVSRGLAEQDELAHHVTLLAKCRGLAGNIGRLAAEHIRERHSVEAAAARYWDVLCGCRN
ncbi:MAG: hypothetical protein ACE141_04255 [Bryobacteraceae bacterium]